MVSLLKPSRPTAKHGLAYRLGWLIGRLIIWFVVGSLALTLLYKFVPVPVTLTW